ncbi:hypothetical protein B0H11DRAFT_2241698 [Mycena galericulata]|nr:hypothetical protein B0H11DRAFT_2241698 [Mycena galericulata]
MATTHFTAVPADFTAIPTNLQDLGIYLAKTPTALADSYFGIDYEGPKTMSYSPDHSVYTVDGQPFVTTLLGQVSAEVKCVNDRRTFRIGMAPNTGYGLLQIFADQANSLAVAVLHDDRRDTEAKMTPDVHVCLNADRSTAQGATYMEVDVDDHNERQCVLYIRDGNYLVPTVPLSDAAWPLRHGDWVVIKATLHKCETKQPYHRREYVILATHILLLGSLDDSIIESPRDTAEDEMTVQNTADLSDTSTLDSDDAENPRHQVSHTKDQSDQSEHTAPWPPGRRQSVPAHRTVTPNLYLEDLEAMATSSLPEVPRDSLQADRVLTPNLYLEDLEAMDTHIFHEADWVHNDVPLVTDRTIFSDDYGPAGHGLFATKECSYVVWFAWRALEVFITVHLGKLG